jgi:hypothetical protein
MLARDIMGVGMPAEFAVREGYPSVAAVTAAGTTTADATVLKKEQRVVEMTASGSDGVRLPSDAELMVPYIVWAKTGAGKVYPPASGTINADAANESQAIAVNLCAMFMRVSTTAWLSICGAVPPAA